MLIDFQTQRDEEYSMYLKNKQRRKTAEKTSDLKANRPKRAGTANPNVGRRTHNPNQIQYTKLYQQLGNKSKNKDVRKSMQARLDAYPPNARVGLQMQLNLNPAFMLDNEGDMTHARETFLRPQTALKTDKVYFRRRDEMTFYADALVRWNKSFAGLGKMCDVKK